MAKKKYLEESERKLIESVNNAYIPTDWDEFEKRYHEMERYGEGKPRKVDKEKMEYIEDGLVSRGVEGNQLSSLLSTIVEESGGNPFSVDDSGKFRGLIQFSKKRYSEKDFNRDKKAGWKKAVDNQLDAIIDHLNEYGGDYGFLNGGDGSGYRTGEDAKNAFWGRDSDIENVTRALTYGFVRPSDRSGTTENRTRVARLINEIIQPPVEAPDVLEFDYDGKHYKATKPEEVTPEMRRALMLSKLVGEKNSVELQDPLYTTFNEAYGRAKNKGAGVFMWNGKKYSTKEEGGEVKDMEKFGKMLESLYNEDVERVRNGERAQYFGALNDKPLENVHPEFDLISKPVNVVSKGADMINKPLGIISGDIKEDVYGGLEKMAKYTGKVDDYVRKLYYKNTKALFDKLPEVVKPLARQVFSKYYNWRKLTVPETIRLSRELFGGEEEPESFDAAFKAAREQGLDTFEWNGNEYSTEMKEEGGETNAAEFSLPEVNIYPNNRFGDIARSQGLRTARQWMEVRNATTKGINDFVNDPRTQFVLGMLPLPMGVEGVEEISNLIKKAKDFRQISKDLRITPWMEQQLIDDAVEKANWRILEDEGALGQGRLITQQDRPSVELTLKPKSQKNSGEYAGGRKFINNKLWWSHRKPFYWGATRDGSKRILYSIDGNNVDLVRAKDLDPEYPNSWVYLTDEVVLTNPKLNAKFFVPTEGGYFIPSSHYRFTQWKDDMVDMMNTVKPEEWAEFRDGGWTKEDEKDFQKWYAKIAEYKGLNPDPDDENQYYDYRTYWLENPEAARKMLEGDPEAHFTDRYKYPGHPTFSDESMYADEEHPGGHWETVDGIGYYVPSEYTKSYIDRTIEYLAGQNEGVYVDGEYRLIPKMPDGGLSNLAPRDNTSVGRPGSAAVQPVKPSPVARENPIVPFVASLLPGIGDVVDAHDFIQAAANKDRLGMALAAVGFIPVVGNAIQEVARLRKTKRLAKMSDGKPNIEPTYIIEESDRDLLEKMPKYAHPNSPLKEAYNYHVERLKHGAYEEATGKRMAEHVRNGYGLEETVPGVYDKVFDVADYTENLKPAVMDYLKLDPYLDYMVGPGEIAAVVNEIRRGAPDSPMTAVGRGHASIVKDSDSPNINMIEGDKESVAKSHELDHAVRFINSKDFAEQLPGIDKWFDSDKTGIPKYFENGLEVAARGSQIKDYFGLTDSHQKITPEMLKYAAKHYVDDVDDNNMTQFFNGIKDWDEAAKWLSKYATAFSGAALIPRVIRDGERDDKIDEERKFMNRFITNRFMSGGYYVDPNIESGGTRYSPFGYQGRALNRRYHYIKKILQDKYGLSENESNKLVDGVLSKSLLSDDYYDVKNNSFGIGGWTGRNLFHFLKQYSDGGLADQIDFLAKEYLKEKEISGGFDAQSGVFDRRQWVVKRIGNEEFYTNSPLLKTLPSMSREDVALSLLPPELWSGILKRKEDVTGKSARKHFVNGGETSELQDYIYDRLTKEHGIAPIQAIGIVANLTQESALNYDALGDNGRSYGIQQWRGDRRKNLFEFAKKRGRDEPALDDQVDFLVEEYKGDGFLFPTRGENMYKTGKTDKDMFDYFQYSKLDFDNAANIYDSTRAWAQGFGRGNKNFLNMDRRFHIAKTLSTRYNIDAGGQSFYTDMGYKDEWGSPVPEVAVSAEKKAAQDDWMEKYGNKMLASILAGDGEGGDTHVTNNYYVNEEGLSEDEKRNAAEVQKLQQKQQAEELLASIIDGIKLDIKGVTEVRKQ